MLLLMLSVGMMLVSGSSVEALIEEIDYEAQNYYNGDYNDYDIPTAITDDDVNDDYVTAGAPCTL